MNKQKTTKIVLRLWSTALLMHMLIVLVFLQRYFPWNIETIIYAFIIWLFAGLPALLMLPAGMLFIRRLSVKPALKPILTAWLMLLIVFLYYLALLWLMGWADTLGAEHSFIVFFLPLFFAVAGSFVINYPSLSVYYQISVHPFNQTNQYMEHHVSESGVDTPNPSHLSGSFTKGLITGGLILLLLIPTFFISGLITERQSRQTEVVKEVSDKWAQAQTFSGPYLYIPYQQPYQNTAGKTITQKKYIVLLPDELSVSGDILPEQRLRSIYKVLLYRTNLSAGGTINLSLPKDVDPSWISFSDARLCVGLSDFKGIEKKISIVFNGKTYDLLPGLPVNDIDATGLSANIDLSQAAIGTTASFKTALQLKGSSYLHLAPLAGNSRFSLRSSWPDPSFDGAILPAERSVNKDGFTAKWEFNKANLPFGTQLQDTKIDKSAIAFGVSMLQTADQYAKTSRSVKYAILIIGLSFSLFFIIEIMQKKPMHPVQYVLIGLAMVIFYSLLLSISEFISFDSAYLVAASATILLITAYTQAHFRNLRTAAVFALALTGLYGFIFVLIRLEDSALLVGTISLFIILGGVMYATRKIRWYQGATAVG